MRLNTTAMANQAGRWSALAISGLLIVACGGPGASPTTPAAPTEPPVVPTPTAAEPTPTAAEPTPTAAEPTPTPVSETVIVEGIAFQTNQLAVPVGSTVTWENRDAVPHTVTHGTNGEAAPSPLFDMALPSGGSVDYTFEQAGSYPVTCTIHPQMQMTVNVGE